MRPVLSLLAVVVMPVLMPALMPVMPAAAQQAAPPPPAESPPTAPLSLEQRMLVRCSAAFALVAHGQAVGDTAALAWPPVGARGREFFVRASAHLIDEAGLTRAALTTAMVREAQDLGQNGALAAAMPPCLAALEASGL